MQAATDYKMPEESLEAREARAREKLRSSAGGRDYLVESEIQRALAAGELDGLAGAGAPLEQREENVFEDLAGMTMVNRVMKDSGAAPPWVEQGKRVRTGLAASRQQLCRAYFDMLAVLPPPSGEADDERDPDEAPKPDWGKADAAKRQAAAETAIKAEVCQDEWPAAMARFVEDVRGLNKDVRRFNLIVPFSWQQQALLSPDDELEKALTDLEQLAIEQREALLERARREAAARQQRRLRNREANGFFGHVFGASWTLTHSEPMPSMFVALREVLEEMLRPRGRGRR